MTDHIKEYSLKEVYLGYYEYITNTNPFILPADKFLKDKDSTIPIESMGRINLIPYGKELYFMETGYNVDILWYTEKLSRGLLLHTKDGQAIVSWKNAKKLWLESLNIKNEQKYISSSANTYLKQSIKKDLYSKRRAFDVNQVKAYLKEKHEKHLAELGLQVQSANTPQAKYDSKDKRLYWNGRDMKCSGKTKKILYELDKNRDITHILKKFYGQNCAKGEKILDSKRNTFDVALSRTNKVFKKIFEVDYDLIEIQNKTVSRNLDIQW